MATNRKNNSTTPENEDGKTKSPSKFGTGEYGSEDDIEGGSMLT